MNLKGIRLSPPAPEPPSAPASPDGTSPPPKDELTTLQQLHADNLRRAMTPVVQGYAEKMKSLAAKTASSDPDASSEYTAEGQRAIQFLDDPIAAVFGGKGPRTGGGAEGFRELRDAAYVQNAQNTGDCFRVKQGGEEFFVRLLWVYCAPTDEKEEKHLKECAEYFGITRDDALVVGREAQEFTSGYLSGKTLTLLTRGTKDDQGNLLVAVRPGKYGDFAGVLVDNGLVMIKQASAKKGPAREHEEAVLRNLVDREAAAKARKVPPGAWARTLAQ
jgi:hypothetical protein